MKETLKSTHGKPARGMASKELQKQILLWQNWAREDLQHAADANLDRDVNFYQGQLQAFDDVLWKMSQKPVSRTLKTTGVSAKLFALVPLAVVVSAVIHENRKDNQPDA